MPTARKAARRRRGCRKTSPEGLPGLYSGNFACIRRSREVCGCFPGEAAEKPKLCSPQGKTGAEDYGQKAFFSKRMVVSFFEEGGENNGNTFWRPIRMKIKRFITVPPTPIAAKASSPVSSDDNSLPRHCRTAGIYCPSATVSRGRAVESLFSLT